MSEFKPTPGEFNYKFSFIPTSGKWDIIEYSSSMCVISNGNYIAQVYEGFHGSWQNHLSNCKLIADAGNTYHSTGMTPSQLAERVKVLEDALRDIIKDEITVYDDYDGCDYIVSMCTEDMIAVAEKALAK